MIGGATAADGLCFKAMQGGKEVKVICVGQPVTFVNCSDPTPADSKIFFYIGTEAADRNKAYSDEELWDNTESPYVFKESGKYIVTLIINRGSKDDRGQTFTEFFEKEFLVKDAPKPSFTATACANRKVNVTITDQQDKQYDFYSVNFGNGQIIEVENGATVSETFNTAGPYNISVTGFYKDATCSSPAETKSVKELPDYVPPAITGLKVLQQIASGGEIQFSLDGLLDGYTYSLISNSGNTIVNVASLPPGTTSYSLSTNTSISKSYKLEVTDACGNTLTGSNTISNFVLTATAGNEQNLVEWNSESRFQSIQLFRNGILFPQNHSSNSYTDQDVVCGVQYCYEIRGTTGENTNSTSAKQCVTGNSTTSPPAGVLLASYNLENQVELSLGLPEGLKPQEIYFSRSSKGAPYKNIAKVKQTTFKDELLKPSEFCYTASYKNECGLTSAASQPSCPVFLTAQQAPDASSVNLDWTPYIGFPDGVASYTVEVSAEDGQPIGTYTVSGTGYIDRNNSNIQVKKYRIKATSNNGAISYSNTVVVEQEVQLHIPSGFTPNGDGLNDVFAVKGRFIEGFSIRIYNGNGQVLFTSNNMEEGWDGTFKGSPLPAGAYAYEVTVTAPNNKIKRRTGTITLLR